ncbi:MAG: DUF3857 domain-containing protein [Terrimonas sp.]|nr:DUF3857 domain-containing protein [Terrimonas sp.]
MTKNIIAFWVLALTSFNTWAGSGDDNYAVSKIAPALLKNADAVLRLEEIRFEIVGPKEASYRVHTVFTILNEKGDDWSGFSEYYDKMRTISSVEGTLYDEYGKVIKKLKNKDIQDLSGVSDISLMDDDRIKAHNFYYRAYPYTVEYDVEIKMKNTFFFPSWVPQGGDRLSVEHSQMAVNCRESYNVRYKAFQYAKEPVITADKGRKTMTWSVDNLPAIVYEPYQPSWNEVTTMVLLGPSDFAVDDYSGNMNNWQDFGKFIYTLKKDRDQLPEKVKATIHSLTDGVTDVRKKIRLLYEFMQKNTRYISIQLGIGGWQPYDATYVAEKGYGDCKALTNYMYSILKEAGIGSNYTIIKAGANAGNIISDFPSQQFNHVILSVPLDKDTVWLECTDQTLPAGYLSDFTADRYALVVNEQGGKLIRTPKYGLNENLEVRKIRAVLNEDDIMKVNIESSYKAEQQDDIHGLINALSKDKVKEYLQKKFNFGTYEINSFKYDEIKSALPMITEKLDLTISNYASITGKRLFITPNIMTRSYTKLKTDTARRYDVILKYEYRDIDTVEIEIPAGYQLEAKPKSININSPFGKYNATVRLEGNKIIYYRLNEQYSGRFAPAAYNDLVKFYDDIYKADRSRVVLVKEAEPEKEKKAF